jgi:site-specific recombinase XerD
MASDALRALRGRQAPERLAAGEFWRDHGLVFCTRVGTPLGAGNVRRSFRAITKAADIGEAWTPRELRHSFVSIMSDHGVSIEAIADLVGHKNSTVTARVYRHQIRPVMAQGAETMDAVFNQRSRTGSLPPAPTIRDSRAQSEDAAPRWLPKLAPGFPERESSDQVR